LQIDTKVFGIVEVDEAQILELTKSMPGFPDYLKFTLLDPDPSNPLKWFQSLDEKNLCFLVADPKCFFPDYTFTLSSSIMADLKLEEGDETAVAVIVTVTEDPSQATANLLAPLVFNTQKKLVRQAILEGSGYQVRARLFEDEKKVCHGG